MNRRRLQQWCAGLGIIILGLVSILWGAYRRHQQPSLHSPSLTVVFLDVGDGDCTLIHTPDGTTALMDAGDPESGPAVVAALHRQGVHKIDLLIMASPDDSSIGGVPAVLNAGFVVKQVWDTAVEADSPARRSALAAVRQRHIPSRVAHAGDTMTLGARATLSVVWPPEHGARARSDALICRLDCGTTRFLLAGAADGEAERFWVADMRGAQDSEVDRTTLLQVAAHGGEDATSPELLRIAAPEVGIISCSAQNSPAPGTMHRLRAVGAAIWRTDMQGSVTVTTDGIEPPAIAPER